MSEHFALRSSVGSRSSGRPSHHHLPPHPRPRPHANPDPLTSAWIRRFHITSNPPPPPPRPPPLLLPRHAPPPPPQDAVSTDESRTPPPPPPRSAGFGPFRWSPRPLRVSWDAATASAPSSGAGPPVMSPFFRLPAPPPPPVADIGAFAPFRPIMFGLGSSGGSGSGSSGSGGFTGLSSRMVVGGGDANADWLSARAAGAAYHNHAVDMVPIRALRDLHDRQHNMIPQNFARLAPNSSSQHDESFSYWNMGRFRRNTITSSISPIAVAHGNFGKRNADSNNFLPLKFRKLSGAI